MKLKNPLIVVKDIDASIKFYKTVLGLKVIMDFGANKVLSGGLALQTLDTWKDFIEKDEISFGGADIELYFETEDFDLFAKKLSGLNVIYVHPVKEHSWGQRVVRIFDPDGHIIEIGESMRQVLKRFLSTGMTIEEAAKRMDVPIKYVKAKYL